MTLQETKTLLEKKLGLNLSPVGAMLDTSNPRYWRQEYQVLSPTGVVVLTLSLSRGLNMTEDTGWTCGEVGHPLSFSQVDVLIREE
jgi:hypothetical protein